MNNIDILEEKEKIKDKLFPITHINGYINLYEQKEARIYTSELSRWQSATKDSLNLIETLIAENKELKEMLKHRIEYTNKLEKDLFQNASNYVIPKSKVEEKIEELENQKRQWIEDRDNKHKDSEIIYAIEVLQSLLEKE